MRVETRSRSLVKSVTWRLVATATTFLVAYSLLGTWYESVSVALLANGIKFLMYYLHERAWNLANWGIQETRERFFLERKYLEEMLSHALEEAPNECCGILAGRQGRVTRVYRLTNVERSPYSYKADPRELFRTLNEIEQNGWELIGIYHSHTYTPAQPSPADIELAFWPDSIYFIVSLNESRHPLIRAFKIRDGRTEEVEVVQR